MVRLLLSFAAVTRLLLMCHLFIQDGLNMKMELHQKIVKIAYGALLRKQKNVQ
jgi:hypothetical protein